MIMNRRNYLHVMGGLALASWPFTEGWSKTTKGRKKNILLFTKSSQYQHDVVKRKNGQLSHAEQVITRLGKQNNFEVTATKDGRIFDTDLDRYDAIFFFTQGDMTPGIDGHPGISTKGKTALLDAIESGKGFVGTHCASDTFHSQGASDQNQPYDQRDPYIQMIGGEFISHGPQQKGTLTVAADQTPGINPLKNGLDIVDEWYALKNFSRDMQVILVQDTRDMDGDDYLRPPYPQTWARNHGKGRVFFTSMGHREDVWTNPNFQQILLSGLSWAVGDLKVSLNYNFKTATPLANQLA